MSNDPKPRERTYFIPYKLFKGSMLPNALMRFPELSSTAKLLWARLAQYAGKDGRCYPSQKTLAWELGISVNRIGFLIKELKEKGFIEAIYPTGLDRILHKTVRYKLVLHPIFQDEYKEKMEEDVYEDVEETV